MISLSRGMRGPTSHGSVAVGWRLPWRHRAISHEDTVQFISFSLGFIAFLTSSCIVLVWSVHQWNRGLASEFSMAIGTSRPGICAHSYASCGA